MIGLQVTARSVGATEAGDDNDEKHEDESDHDDDEHLHPPRHSRCRSLFRLHRSCCQFLCSLELNLMFDNRHSVREFCNERFERVVRYGTFRRFWP